MERGVSRMIGVRLQVGIKKLGAGGLDTAARRFDSHKHRVDFSENVRVLELKHPAVLFLIVYIEDSQTLGWALCGSACAPNLEGGISPCGAAITQVKGIKDQ